MARCRYCGNSINWVEIDGKKVPVEGMEEVNILPFREGKLIGITSSGDIVKGIEVGDACESGYWICKIKHLCERRNL